MILNSVKFRIDFLWFFWILETFNLIALNLVLFLTSKVALRRQQAQEENEVRDLGLLYTGGGVHSVGQPVGESNGQLPGQSQFHTGIPSPPNDSDGGNRGGYGTVDGRLCFFLMSTFYISLGLSRLSKKRLENLYNFECILTKIYIP